ncbi:HIT zinc finger, putative [Trypanosoma equiperdum]|uniref:HIT-type domain-containing protein n=2 Tax=Trypanozoon TaxID=39700 RepID=Q385E0_TRYB2|nr:hypothetical protein, conserved [Trypanosoma brucei brucei TREU927]EAN79591.1 hypothetical protein, conserved [Trypanosoma brucei brucei TREU927]SCU70731.1 HIT zinc finger, putative [Trypanosoma equiperdum]
MVGPRIRNTYAQQLQEERLEKLCDDNAFVNVTDVLRRQRRDAPPANGVASETEFLEESVASATAPSRIHLSRFILEQHRTYLKAMGLNEDEKQHRETKAEGDSSSVSTWSSAASSEKDELVAPPVRGKRMRRDAKPHAEKDKRSGRRTSCGSASGNNDDIECDKDSTTASSDDLARECQYIRSWLLAQGLNSSELRVPPVSYASMTAPPPAHAGGHHLCSVCLLPAGYRCVRCRTALFCSIECHVVHEATRCMKFIV